MQTRFSRNCVFVSHSPYYWTHIVLRLSKDERRKVASTVTGDESTCFKICLDIIPNLEYNYTIISAEVS